MTRNQKRRQRGIIRDLALSVLCIAMAAGAAYFVEYVMPAVAL